MSATHGRLDVRNELATAAERGALPNANALMAEEIARAAALAQSDRRQAIAQLNAIFHAGRVPGPELNGRTSGDLVATSINSPLDWLVGKIVRVWLPWQGKTFDVTSACGDNIFTNDSRVLGRLFTPGYRGYIPDSDHTYRAFRFRTYVAAGLEDADRQVLKIDYDLPGNPTPTVRRVLDELVQIADGLYLGKAHVKWWWGTWQRVAFFTLAR